MLASMERIIRRALGRTSYMRSFGVEVQVQHDDGSVDVLPDAVEVRGEGFQRVPVMVSPAGTRVRVEPGTRGLLSFADGDPRKPRIVAWEYRQGSAVLSLDDGGAGVARNGDLIELCLSASTPIAGVMSGTVTSPPPANITTPVPAGTQFSGVAVVTAAIRGRIFGGAQRVRA